MNTNWQIFKVFRRDLWIFMGVEIAMVLLIAVNDIRLHKPESALDSLGVSAFLALLLSISLRMPSRLNRMPFPVSVAHRARLPVLAFLVLFGSGIAAVFAACTIFGFSLDQWRWLGMLILRRVPFYVLAFLVVYRFFQRAPHLIGCVFIVIFLPESMNASGYTVWDSWYFLLLPAALALIAFYWIEIPRQLAGQDRLLIAQGYQPMAVMRDINIEPRQTWITWTGRIMDAMLIFGVLLVFAFRMTDLLFRGNLLSIQTYVSRPWLCWFPLVGLFFVYMMSKEGYQRAAASGFGPYSSVWMSLMRITIILNPLTKALGVKKGVVARCDQCRTAKFIWARRCPHCGFPGPGTILNKQMARLARGDAVRVTIRQKIIFRLLIPLQLLLMFGVFSVGNRPFEVQGSVLMFKSAQVASQAATWIEAWIETHADTETWLTSGASVVQAPQKYRLQVVYTEGRAHMSLQAYGVRWDSAGPLADLLIDHLGPSLKEAFDFTTTPIKHEARSPFMQTRTYLDNKLHWVQRDKAPTRIIKPRKSSREEAPMPLVQKPVKKMPTPPPKRIE
ncbi:MAG: hypothetical protein HQ515_05560 [Phycisphaeraceae bacterium]|nr:hypothetical protein [Phycisphaeraceae bacterium]